MRIRKPKFEEIISRENSLQEFLFDEELDFEGKTEHALSEMIQDIKSAGMKISKLNTPLTLEIDGTKSLEDNVERLRVIVTTTSLTGNATGVLSGTNDSDDETWTVIKNNIIISEIGEYSFIIDNPFKYYKLVLTGTIEATAQIIENVWELPLLFLTTSLIYRALSALADDNYYNKAEYYLKVYNDTFQTVAASYDYDLDGTIDDAETEKTTKEIRFLR